MYDPQGNLGTEQMTVNLACNLIATPHEWHGATALKHDETVLSYEALDEATARVAGLLRTRGVRPGDRVAMMLPNLPAFVLAYYGALRADAVVVPVNVLFKKRETAFHFGDAGARLVLAWHEFAGPAEEGAAEAGADCLVVFPGELKRAIELPVEVTNA